MKYWFIVWKYVFLLHVLRLARTQKKNENITITGYWALNENRKIDSQQEKLVGPNRKN